MTKTGVRGSTQEPQFPLKHDYPALRATQGPFSLLGIGVKLGSNFP